jgi:short-subunit dehydrogenase
MATALITGASGGIGAELAKIHARNRHNLILAARSADRLETIKRELEGAFSIRVDVIAIDLSEPGAAHRLFELAGGKDLQVDFLINNAGFGTFGMFAEAEIGKTEEMMRLNMEALTVLTRLVLPGMIARKSGRIMNIASTAAFQPGPLMAVYFASKAYVLRFSEAIANEVQGSGVSITAYCPAATQTGFQTAARMEDSRLVKNRKLDSAENVAQDAFKAMMVGKTVAIYGWINALLAWSTGLFPSAMVAKIARWMVERKG